MDIMTPKHPKWNEFCNRLGGGAQCNGDRNQSKAILKDMGMNVIESFNFFDKHGGYCDCEILMNMH